MNAERSTQPKRAQSATLRLAIILALAVIAAYLAGARWGMRHPEPHEAPAAATAANVETGTTPTEALDIRIYRQASPAVVNITSRILEMDFFFNVVPVQGIGSGFIIDDRGHVLTNFHVVQGARQLDVALSDKTHYPARVIGADPANDVALLKIEPRGKRLPTVPLGDSSRLQVGQHVLAIGNPFGLQGTLTAGVVSALGRTIRAEEGRLIEDLIQTDASINHGNSGGPLLNTRGEVVGINSAMFTPSGQGGSVGINFAIPINTAKQITEELLTTGHIRRAWLGIASRDVDSYLAYSLNLPVNEGIFVARIGPGSPADRAGLERGDIIVAVDERAVASRDDLNAILAKKRPGDRVSTTVYRGRRQLKIPILLGERPE